MKLIIQPEDGASSLMHGIDSATESIEIAIFRFDHVEVKRALERAVSRGVSVHALIANTNHGNEKDLRKLEMELLGAGIEVSRTARDLLRHHYKFMVVDRSTLYLLTFNFTYLDMDDTRSFGLITEDREIVAEAVKLFYADIKRQPYLPGLRRVLVSPLNARHELSRFLRGSRKQLLIYNPEVSDRAILEVLQERAHSGVDIRIIGRLAKEPAELRPARWMRRRFRTRAIVRDGRDVFLGSQIREAANRLRPFEQSKYRVARQRNFDPCWFLLSAITQCLRHSPQVSRLMAQVITPSRHARAQASVKPPWI
jgi:phosphatidylserine/phosphatidylglycerophosphate/cardiolipin synthase-like enzyme